MDRIFLQVEVLQKHFPVTEGFIRQKVTGWIKAVDGVSFAISERETFGLVGESGCGKTTIAKLLLLLEKPTAGSLFFRGKNINSFRGAELSGYRRSVQAVFQDPFSSLDPRMRVRDIISEPISASKFSLDKKTAKERVAEVLEQVGLGAKTGSLYPHEFSGGQRQRIAVARALASKPQCVILDEPISALDVLIRAQIMNLLNYLQESIGLSFLIISHDLAAVKHMSKTLGVMYLGKIVEMGNSEAVYGEPLHPYTKGLLSAALPTHPDIPRKEIILTGEVPTPLNPPSGCRFHTRCFEVKPICLKEEPSLKSVASSHLVACHVY